MRFALMTEPQMGLTYADQLAVVPRAEAAGFETFFRSDHYESFPGETDQPTTDAWAVLAGLARDTTRIGLGVLVSPVTFRNARQPRQGRGDRRRDERRPGRGRGRRRLARGRAQAPRLPVPGDRRAGRHARGDARDPARPVGGAGRLVVHRQALHGRGRVLPPEAGVAPGPRRRPAAGSSSAARGRRARTGSPRATPTSSTCRRPRPHVADDEVREARRRLRATGRDPSTLAHSAMVGLLIGRTTDEVKDREQALLVGVRGGGVRTRGVARAAPAALDLRDAGRGAVTRWPQFEEAGRPAAHAPGLPRPRPRHDRSRGGGAVRLRAARSRAARASPLLAQRALRGSRSGWLAQRPSSGFGGQIRRPARPACRTVAQRGVTSGEAAARTGSASGSGRPRARQREVPGRRGGSGRVRAAGGGDLERHELERPGGPEQGRHGRGEVRRLGHDDPARRA